MKIPPIKHYCIFLSEPEALRAGGQNALLHCSIIFGGIGGSTDLGLVADALKPEKVDVACFGLVRASDIRAHAADEFVYVEDLITMTKELVHYFAF